MNRELAKHRIDTDTESLEWINHFLVKFWPIFQPVLAETIINSVDQVLSTSTPAFLDSLRMKTFTLGTKPPRLEHVKTYPKADDDTVLMDWKFSFTPNDHADMTVRQIKTKVNPKIVLEVRIGKAMISKGLDVIVEDMAFSGLMQVKIKLQIPFPHVEKVEICFLERRKYFSYLKFPGSGCLLRSALESLTACEVCLDSRPAVMMPDLEYLTPESHRICCIYPLPISFQICLLCHFRNIILNKS
jgi:Ca2+-dependent lipid-binding protein